MKKINIAFLYNIRHHYPDPGDPRTHLEADFDDPQTIEWMIRHIKKMGHDVIAIEADERAYLTLLQKRAKIDLAFNYQFGLHGVYKYGHIPAMLEMLKIPFTSASSFTQALTLNKVKMKQILIANGISTLPYQIFNSSSKKKLDSLKFPLIVKPVAQGSSAGISDKSVVYSQKELKRQVDFIEKTLKQPAFAEPFLKWREFSVGLLGNPPKILPIIEPNYSLLPKKYLPLDSFEVKWIYEEEVEINHLICPARIDDKLRQKIESIALAAWEALNIKDLCRIDMRIDDKNNLYILDVNSPPGLVPPEVSLTSYFPLACRAAGIEYDEMLQTIINSALKRYDLV